MVLLKAPIGGAFQHFDHSGKSLKIRRCNTSR